MSNVGIVKYGIFGSGQNIGRKGILGASGGFDPNAAAFFAANEAAGGTIPALVKTEYNAHVTRGTYTRSDVKREFVPVGGAINAVKIDAVSLTDYTNNNFVDGDCDATCGLQGDNISKQLLTDVNLSSILTSVNKSQGGYFLIGSPENTNGEYPFGVISGGNEFSLRYITGQNRASIGGTLAVGANIAANNSVIAARFSSTLLYAVTNGVESPASTTPSTTGLPASPLGLFRGLGFAGYANEKWGGAFLSEFDALAELKAYEASYKLFLTNIGVI